MFIYELTDPWAEHPVVNRHVCNGGDGGDAPPAPDYSQYIAAASDMSNQGMTQFRSLVANAEKWGINLRNIAQAVSGAAGRAATSQQRMSDRLYGDWQKTYDPLYKAQAADAQRMIGELPKTEEAYAGSYASDAAAAIEQGRQSAIRDMEGRGLAPSAISTGALNEVVNTTGALTRTAAAQQGRTAARNEARGATTAALTQGQFVPQVAGAQAGQATQNLALRTAAPNAAASTSAQLYSPALGFYGASQAPLFQWGSTMANAYNQNLAKYKIDQEAGANSPLTTMGAMGLGVLGSYAGSAGGSGTINNLISGGGGGTSWMASNPSAWKASGTYAEGGSVPDAAINTVPPSASPSGGQQVDDVNAMLSEGEFVIPKRTVDWLGEKFLQNLIAKADKEQGQQTVAEPEQSETPAAMATQPPMFRSEGART